MKDFEDFLSTSLLLNKHLYKLDQSMGKSPKGGTGKIMSDSKRIKNRKERKRKSN